MRRFLLLVCLLGFVAAKCGRQRGRNIFEDSDEDDNKCPSIFDSDESHSSAACGRRGRGSGCCLQNSNSVDISTSQIARLLIAAGNQMQRFCTAHSDRTMREVYGVEHYQLRVSLEEFSEEHIQVQVRQRLVSVQARSCSQHFAAVRILPEVVDRERAVWKFDGGKLTVLFPYNVTPNSETESRCGRGASNNVITVPQCAAGTTFDPDYDVNFDDAKLREAIRRFFAEPKTTTRTESPDSGEHYIDYK